MRVIKVMRGTCPSWFQQARHLQGTPCAFFWEGPQYGTWTWQAWTCLPSTPSTKLTFDSTWYNDNDSVYLVEVEVLDLLLETRRKTRVHTTTTRQNNVRVELGTSINVGLIDAIKQLFGHTQSLNIHQVGLEECLWGLEPLSSYLDDTSIGELLVYFRLEQKEWMVFGAVRR